MGLLLKTVATPPAARIAAPGSVAVSSATSGAASLSWATVSGATGYRVRRGLASNGYTTTTTLGVVLSDSASGLTNGVAHYFCVTAIGADNESIYSSEVSVTPIAAPTGVVATPGSSLNTLTWATMPGATSYTIRKGTTSGTYSTTITAGNVTSYVDTGLTPGTTYYYRVYATGPNATSADSAEFNATAAGAIATTAIGGDNDGDYLRINSADYPASTGSFSGSIWARRTADRNTYNWFYVFENPAGHSTEWTGFMLDADGTTLYFENTAGHVISLGTMTQDVWKFFAFSINGTSLTVWHADEGASSLTKLTSGSYSAISGFGELGIGASVFHASEWFNGDVAMARIWDGQLSDAEALAEFLSVTAVKTTNLKGAWPLASVATAANASTGTALTTSGFSSYVDVTGPTVG